MLWEYIGSAQDGNRFEYLILTMIKIPCQLFILIFLQDTILSSKSLYIFATNGKVRNSQTTEEFIIDR